MNGWLLGGIDLAWGERLGDGICWIRGGGSGWRVDAFAYPHGDAALRAELRRARAACGGSVFLAVDAPLIVPNATGARPVDRLTHAVFRKAHAGSHPANTARCVRPLRVRALLEAEGCVTGWDADGRRPVCAEVFPHPALVRFCGLDRIVKYKRGRVAERRAEFARLQGLLRRLAAGRFPYLDLGPADDLLRQPWSKPVEDRTDAFICACIALWHVVHAGARSEVLGDAATGFILLPAA